jgi:peptidoglycan/xylan/chitin deacetylase (PgdA/CDA1 family)
LRKHIRTVVMPALITVGALAVFGVALAAGSAALKAGKRSDEGSVVSSFTVDDSQSVLPVPAPTTPTPTYSPPRLHPNTARRLSSHKQTSIGRPPEYLIAQGLTRDANAGMRVALTFDDGPSLNTTAVLGILTRYHAHATFFFIGGRATFPGHWQPAVLRAVLKQGSEIGNHTLQHEELYKMTLAQDEAQIQQADDIFYRMAGVHPLYVRPQGGYLDATGLEAIKALHKMYVYWDCAGFDTVADFTSTDIYDSVMENVRPGSVVLLHETNHKTVAALPRILQSLEHRGYQVDDVSGLLKR